MHLHTEADSQWQFCCDNCHRDFCNRDPDLTYDGWDGCHEVEHTVYCDNCGVVIPGYADACSHQRANFIVNRFPSKEGERCSHGKWIQIPEGMQVTLNG